VLQLIVLKFLFLLMFIMKVSLFTLAIDVLKKLCRVAYHHAASGYLFICFLGVPPNFSPQISRAQPSLASCHFSSTVIVGSALIHRWVLEFYFPEANLDLHMSVSQSTITDGLPAPPSACSAISLWSDAPLH
jgi:hypothetical protein